MGGNTEHLAHVGTRWLLPGRGGNIEEVVDRCEHCKAGESEQLIDVPNYF